jgi:NADH:ubiquinone oxidoreductase subunit 5 (subunit L)/multisubunit Na+/H+ antiporter MnhA subunit
MFAWSLELAWLIVLLPFAAFALIGLFLHRWPRLSASVSILAIGLSFALSVLVAANVTRQFLLMQNKYFASSTNPGKLS